LSGRICASRFLQCCREACTSREEEEAEIKLL
jgi:hypothetical protein